MKNAGKKAARELLRKFGKPKSVQIFCGSGGNGGDGAVIGLELLKNKIGIEIILISEPKNKDSKFYLAKLPKNIVSKFSKKTKIRGEILVDAILGVGQKGKLRSPISEIIVKLKKSKSKIVSLDVPTDNLKSDLVVAFHSSKNSQNEIVVPIGIPTSAEKFFGPGDVEFYFPKRKLDSHKNQNGRIVIVGGSREFVGAPLFAGFGAISAGVDLVDVFVPQINFEASRKFCSNLLIHEFLGNSNFLTIDSTQEILNFTKEKKAALVIGPGLDQSPETRKAIKFLTRNFEGEMVLDASALISDLRKFKSKKVVLTPHLGEFRRLPKNLKAVILKKGQVDEITFGKRKRWNDSGSPILTVGGSGDVLAGLVGGLLSRGIEPFEAAGIGSFLLGIAGQKIGLKSESATPQQIVKIIPKIIQEIFLKKI